MKSLLPFAASVFVTISSFAGDIKPCSEDPTSAKHISQLTAKRAKTLVLTDAKGESVGALFLGDAGNPADMILCGLYKDYFYVNGDLASWGPEVDEYRQIATVESATIYQDEALMSAFSFTDDYMGSTDHEVRVRVFFQYVDLAEGNSEAGEFYVMIPR